MPKTFPSALVRASLPAKALAPALAIVLAVVLVLVLAAPRSALAADKLKQCVAKCKKPASTSINYDDAAKWRKEVSAELGYDECVLNCEKAQMPASSFWYNTGFMYPSMAGF